MDCNARPLEQLASGDLPLPAILLQYGHILRCPSCRVRYRRARNLLSQLRNLSEAPVSGSLRRRALAALPCSVTPEMTGGGEKVTPKMRRLTYTALCIALIVAVTGALAAKLLFRPSFGCSDGLGRTWHITGDFHGAVDILDAKGNLGGRVFNGFGKMTEPVEITSSGETVIVQGSGRHEVRGKNGTLFGYAVLRPLTEKEYLASQGLARMPTPQESLERQAQDWADMNWDTGGGVSGTQSAPWGVRGFDSAAGLRWRMLGTGSVQVVDGTGKKVLASAQTGSANLALPPSLRRYAEAGEPEILVTYGKRTWKESGYGTHKFKDDSGRVLLVIEALPASQ